MPRATRINPHSILRTTIAFVAFIAFIAIATALAPHARADGIDDDYAKRFKAIKHDDIPGHVDLAKWARDQERWGLVSRQCTHILRQEPNHAVAKLLLDQARANLKRDDRDAGLDPADPNAVRRAPSSGSGSGPPRLLNRDEIQKIRRAEFDPDSGERLSIRIDRRMLRDFAESMQGSYEFPFTNVTDFYKSDRNEQAGLMLRFGSEKHKNAVAINGDPARIKEFDRVVVPYVQQNCATSDCHGGGRGGKLKLLGGRSLANDALYTNFYLLHEHTVGTEHVINRQAPHRSLLLTAGLPPSSDPDFKNLSHPTPVVAPFDGDNHPLYRDVLEWLRSLNLTRPDYDIDPDQSP
jgi:hypothetical protein